MSGVPESGAGEKVFKHCTSHQIMSRAGLCVPMVGVLVFSSNSIALLVGASEVVNPLEFENASPTTGCKFSLDRR